MVLVCFQEVAKVLEVTGGHQGFVLRGVARVLLGSR